MDHIGIPGIGGSLGQCQICGGDFIMDILFGNKVAAFELDAFKNQVLYCHVKCRSLIKTGMDFNDLPIKSPIRIAFTKAAQPA